MPRYFSLLFERNCGWIGVFILGVIFSTVSNHTIAQDQPLESKIEKSVSSEAFAKTISPALQNYCVKCHNHQRHESDIDLQELNLEDLSSDHDLISQLIGALDREEMPPADENQPDPALRKLIVTELKSILQNSAASQANDARTRTPMRRMTRFQYNNAVIDLFDLNCIVFTLPERMMREHKGYFKPHTGKMADVVTVGNRPLGKSQMIEPRLAGVAAFPQDLRAEHGFDNQADHLSLSPLLMEAFLKLGKSITNSPDFVPRRIGIWKEFFAPPNEEKNLESEIRLRLKIFLTRAFRQPADKELVDRYTGFVMAKLKTEVEFSDAMKLAAAAAISSPKFLYLYNKRQDHTDATQSAANAVVATPVGNAIDDFELASRLSFFLWGSIPDPTLLDLAANGELHQADVLNEQVDRMLQDKKLKRFCDSFPAQWLQLDRLISTLPNREKFKQFYFLKYRNSMHMMMEPLLLFETVLIENKSITQLIDSDFTYRSTKLQNAYAKLNNQPAKAAKPKGGGVTALRFTRAPVTDRRNGGVITNAAVMAMTSGPDRTQPITRGAWVASVIFNNPPQPPPANVPELEESPVGDEADMTVRERLAAHRKRADCKGCHEKIDPLGFALENYNAIGVWRDKYENGRDVDMAGTLFRKHRFTSVVEFKDAMLAEKDRFAKGFTGHLLSFALARELHPADQLAIDKIAAATAKDGYRFQTMLREVIMSDSFRNK